MNNTIRTIIITFSCLTATHSFAKTVELDDLYARYQQADYSTLELEEFDQEIEFKGVIAGRDHNLSGGTVFDISSPSDPETAVARLLPREDVEKKFQKLKDGQSIQAKCILGMASGSDFMTLDECELK